MNYIIILDVITMKKAITFVMVWVLLSCLFVGCGKNAATPLEFTKEGITQIAISTPNNKNAILTEVESITSLMLALENAKCVSDDSLQHSVVNEQYRFTTYNKERTELNTFLIFSNEYIQVGTTLYKGNLTDVIAIINNSFNQKLEKLETASPVFTTETADITEIAFHNILENSFKIVTVQEDIDSIMVPLKNLKISEKTVNGEPTETYRFYIRLKNTNEYLSPIEINRHSSGSTCKVDNKTSVVSNYNWGVLYEKLNYNTMPIKK